MEFISKWNFKNVEFLKLKKSTDLTIDSEVWNLTEDNREELLSEQINNW